MTWWLPNRPLVTLARKQLGHYQVVPLLPLRENDLAAIGSSPCYLGKKMTWWPPGHPFTTLETK
jgi:hypothetical protein